MKSTIHTPEVRNLIVKYSDTADWYLAQTHLAKLVPANKQHASILFKEYLGAKRLY